ncbi:uncharacterized protein MYCGRDRAFT_88859 [Zymoseptoria tritici IPO323]|uniref:non-specific serine/threonine protein kinase n=1 Tax=Zymoseptoria tritici (strain CBS 115943 / IPO323) TaxID=336722 RepID=F9WW65_ZYMTI|nr:uncharacterized protein MYCGRDRAFT_88859 [Zymoseptoria tritici IPO323]EGP92644.1 hypothetical protein MYCGRDRAFT_88859 [Zymoseptoria tritici IPO323]
MAAKLFADFEVLAQVAASDARTRKFEINARKVATTEWNAIAPVDQNGLRPKLTLFHELHAQMEAETTTVLGDEPLSNVRDITNYIEKLRVRVDRRGDHVLNINRLMDLRSAGPERNRVDALAYLRRLRIKQGERRQDDRATITKLLRLLAAAEQRNLEGRLNDRWVGVGGTIAGGFSIPQIWVKRSTANVITDQRSNEWHPEPFLWSIFEDLVIAGLLLERGSLGPAAPAPGWDLIVHRDIKLGNIFLGTNTSDTFQGYPTAKLGDFGAACFVPANDQRRFGEFDHEDFGTETDKAPEQLDEVLFGRPNRRYKIGTKTNIWAIGNAMWGLVNYEEGDVQLEDGFREDYKVPAAFSDTHRGMYSSTLLRLITRCIQYLPENRPNLSTILFEIQRATGPGANDRANGLRNAPKNDPGFMTRRGPHLKAEQYKLRTLLTEWTEEIFPLPASRKRKSEDFSIDDRLVDTRDPDAASIASDDDLGGEQGSNMVPTQQDLAAGLVFDSDGREDGGVGYGRGT